ncbi:MAG: hypothetical protein AAFR83_23065 [Cyanobacteria bacterium J06629_18]
MLYTANSSKLMGRPRITVTVSEDVFSYLSEWAEREERPLANLTAYLLSQAVREHQQQNDSSPSDKDKGAA